METIPREPLRLWPGVLAAVLLSLSGSSCPASCPGRRHRHPWRARRWIGVVWWLFFSRAPWSDRIGAIVVMVGAVLATSRIVHVSIANGMMGMMLPIFSIPALSITLVASAAASRRLSDGPRRAAMATAILLACGAFTLLRTGGITGAADSDLHWRWTKTPEELLLAQSGYDPAAPSSAPAAPAADSRLPSRDRDEPAAPAALSAAPEPFAKPPSAPAGNSAAPLPAAAAATETGADWPGFRGPHRDDVIPGVRIKTDWAASPPVELWRRAIGPGWSSFAVRGDLLFTQEQRGDYEIVACYSLSTGKPVWMHRDKTRFWESNGGAGPRATPTFSNGRVYSLVRPESSTRSTPATDRWSGRATRRPIPARRSRAGFASSPLVIGDEVVVHAGVLVAYDRATEIGAGSVSRRRGLQLATY